jgi:hypothetical protein
MGMTKDEMTAAVDVVKLLVDVAVPHVQTMTEEQRAEVLWQFIAVFTGRHQGAPLRLIDYDDMLMPNLGYKFTTLPRGVFADLQTKARKLLLTNSDPTLPKILIDHWEKISAGVIPFGYVLAE